LASVIGSLQTYKYSGTVSEPLSDRFYRRGRVDKVNAELVTLTYGTVVAQLCSDYDANYAEVNKQLDKMGYSMGMRLIEDFFAKSGSQRCANFRETAETISKVSCRQPFIDILFSRSLSRTLCSAGGTQRSAVL